MPSSIFRGPAEFLFIEDDPGEVRLFQEALREVPLLVHLTAVPDGESALALLRGQEPYASALHPHLIFLSLKLPQLDGLAVIRAIKSDPQLRRTPVLVLTSSENPRDIVQSYEELANAYILKPTDLDRYVRAVRTTVVFWLTVATLPPA